VLSQYIDAAIERATYWIVFSLQRGATPGRSRPEGLARSCL